MEDFYVFKILCNYQSYSTAAEHLDKTQGTISSQINRIEEILNVKLIDRTSRMFEITEDGKKFLEYAEKILNLFQNLLDDYEKDRLTRTGTLSGNVIISSSTIPGEYILPHLFGEFKKLHPEVNFKISLKNSSGALKDLQAEDVDFAAVGMKLASNQKQHYDILEIGSDEILLISSSVNSLVEKKEKFELKDVFKYPFIMREEGSGTRKAFEQSENYSEKIKTALVLNSNQSILSTLKGTDFISVLSSYTISTILNLDKENTTNQEYQVLKPIDFSPIKRKFYLLKLKNEQKTEPKKTFWDFCKIKIN